MSIAITGASGQLGRATTAAVLAQLADPQQLVLISRNPGSLADAAALGADVRRGDFDEPASLEGAFAGVERLLLISTDSVDERVAGHVAAIQAAKAAGVQHVIYTSITAPTEANPARVVPDHAATEQALLESGLAWTFLRNNLYAQLNVAALQQAADSGRLVVNSGNGGTAYVDRGDVAEVAAVLLARGGHEGEALDVTGPEAVTAEGLAAIAAQLSGREVEVVDLEDAAYVQGLTEAAGFPASVAQLFASFGTAARGGHLGEVSGVVQQLTGRPPRSVRDVVAEAFAATPAA